MTESLLKFRDRITRKAIRNFDENQAVTRKEFVDFVNYKMGTEIQDDFMSECYENFLKERQMTKNPRPSSEL